MKITNEESEPFGVICGWRYGTDIIVTGGSARLIFHSNSEVQKKGFNISFTVIPKPGEYNRKIILLRHTLDRVCISVSQNNRTCHEVLDVTKASKR